MRRGGFGVSRTTPAEIVDKLNTVVNAALSDPNSRASTRMTGLQAPLAQLRLTGLIVNPTRLLNRKKKSPGDDPGLYIVARKNWRLAERSWISRHGNPGHRSPDRRSPGRRKPGRRNRTYS